jgi:hypothetical protein
LVDGFVGAEGDEFEGGGRVLKEEAGVEAGAAFEEVVVEFADVEAGVEVGLAEFFREAGEGEGDFVALGVGESIGEGLEVRGDEEGFGHGGRGKIKNGKREKGTSWKKFDHRLHGWARMEEREEFRAQRRKGKKREERI